jgi:N-acetylglucosaminyl-diphospho-decaprenol L-rhamnosyltransferase
MQMPNAVPANEPRVVIGIVSTNDVQNVLGCLNSLDRSVHRNFFVVICENGGADGFDRAATALAAADILRRDDGADDGPDISPDISWGQGSARFRLVGGGQPVVLLKSLTNRGYAGGVNTCIAAAWNDPWDAIWVLNPDTFPERDALTALVRRQRAGGYGIVGSKLVFVANGLIQTWGGLRWFPLLGRGRLLGYNQHPATMPDIAKIERQTKYVCGASMYVTREYVDEVGGMDQDFFVYDEDVDWCLRRGRFTLGYAHDSVVHHIHGATAGASSTHKATRSRFNIYMTERNRILIARKRFGAKWPLLASIALVQTLEHLLRVRSLRQFGFAIDGWWAGVRGEVGPPAFMRDASHADVRQFLRRDARVPARL